MNPMDTRSVERSALVALLRRPKVSWTETAVDLLESGRSATALLEEHLREAEGMFPDKDAATLQEEAAALVESWESAGIGVHACFDDAYPAQLRDIREMPPIVFTRGTIEDDQRAIAVVGTRTASPDGIARAQAATGILADQGITIVSGLAAGIDTAAHKTALALGARTVAVVGTGIDRYYPKQNSALQNTIAARGLVLSQFWPDAAPSRKSFPMRNAIMSGYAAATVVIEASQQSGTRIQARHALDHGRAVVLLREVLGVQWAREISDRPGVAVVDGPDEFLSAIKEILSARLNPVIPRLSE